MRDKVSPVFPALFTQKCWAGLILREACFPRE